VPHLVKKIGVFKTNIFFPKNTSKQVSNAISNADGFILISDLKDIVERV
jgi:hypothetical protein